MPRILPLAAALIASLALPALAQQPRTIRAGETVSGEITRNTPKEEDGTGYVLHQYRGTPGERILVELKSADFDAFLTIGNRHTEPGCSDCRRDDDGGGGTDSRLRHALPASGEVQIRAGMVNSGGAGRYTLSVSPLPPPVAPRPRALAVGQQVEGQLGNASSLDDEDRPYELWTLQGQPGKTLVLRMDSDALDPVLQFGRWNGSDFTKQAEDDDGGQGLNARLRVQLDAEGRGAVRAIAFGNGNGSYRLSAREVTPPPAVRISDIGIGDSVQGRLESGDSFAGDEDAYFDVFRIRGKAGQRVMVRLDSSDFDTVLRWGVMDGNVLIQDSEDDDGGGGTNSRLTVTLDAAGEGRLVVGSIGAGEGAYTLSVVNAPRAAR